MSYRLYKYRHYICLSVLLLVTCVAVAANPDKVRKGEKQMAARIEAALGSITENAARAHVGFLADDLLEGRRAGRRGSQIARQYIISQLRQLGIKPFVGDAYTQPFTALGLPRLRRTPRYFVEADSLAAIRFQPHCSLSLGNVLGAIPGVRDDEYVIIGAHFDHEGMNAELEGDSIYNGADDNASGVSAVLQIMKAFVTGGVKPLRTVVFAFWDGEEYGLLGSRYFTDTFEKMDKVKGYLNFDMIGGNNRQDDPSYFVYFYTAGCPWFGDWLRNDIDAYRLCLNPDYRAWDNPVGGSDQSSFARKGVPVIWYHTDAQPHYNQPTDEASTLNYPKLTDITRASFLTAWHLANDGATANSH